MPEDMHGRWMHTVLTDNGEEYADEDGIGALGIREVGRDELMLRPEILDIERERRGEPPLTRLK